MGWYSLYIEGNNPNDVVVTVVHAQSMDDAKAKAKGIGEDRDAYGFDVHGPFETYTEACKELKCMLD